MKWGPEHDQEILLYILANCEVKVPYDGIAKRLGVTAKAVTHRIANIKKMAAERQAEAGNAGSQGEEDDDGEEAQTPTPKKRKRAPPKKKTDTAPAPKKRGMKAPKVEVEEPVDDEVDEAELDIKAELKSQD